jgi:hypothetical protein
MVDRAAWIVIHADEDGKPGKIIGRALLAEGESQDVFVTISAREATRTLYAVLYTDAGQPGKFEAPEIDTPFMDGRGMVMQSFQQIVE